CLKGRPSSLIMMSQATIRPEGKFSSPISWHFSRTGPEWLFRSGRSERSCIRYAGTGTVLSPCQGLQHRRLRLLDFRIVHAGTPPMYRPEPRGDGTERDRCVILVIHD